WHADLVAVAERLTGAHAGDPAVEAGADVIARNGEVDHTARDAGHRHAHHLAALVDDRSARITGVHAAVALDAVQHTVALPQRRHRRRADGDLLAQLLAQGEAEDVHLVQLLDSGRRRDLERFGHV